MATTPWAEKMSLVMMALTVSMNVAMMSVASTETTVTTWARLKTKSRKAVAGRKFVSLFLFFSV